MCKLWQEPCNHNRKLSHNSLCYTWKVIRGFCVCVCVCDLVHVRVHWPHHFNIILCPSNREKKPYNQFRNEISAHHQNECEMSHLTSDKPKRTIVYSLARLHSHIVYHKIYVICLENCKPINRCIINWSKWFEYVKELDCVPVCAWNSITYCTYMPYNKAVT